LAKWTDFGFLDCLHKVSPSARSHDCQEIHLFTSQFEQFYARVSQKLSFCVEKSSTWMNWRFLNRPGSPYTAYAIGNNEEQTGYIVLKRWQDPDGNRKAHIMDLHAIDDAALAHLIAAAESYACDCQELNLWAVQGYVYRTSLESLGFVPRESARQPLIARPLNSPLMTFPEGCCSLSYGDGDSQY
jgi:hypothetical protein